MSSGFHFMGSLRLGGLHIVGSSPPEPPLCPRGPGFGVEAGPGRQMAAELRPRPGPAWPRDGAVVVGQAPGAMGGALGPFGTPPKKRVWASLLGEAGGLPALGTNYVKM